MTIKALIIEDEPFAQQELIRLLKNTGKDLQVLACIDSLEESIVWFEQNVHPDLVFMDIQLSDGLSFELFKSVKIQSPVIFTTAFDEYAIRAFKVNSIDYLLKPIEQQQLNDAIEKFENLHRQQQPVYEAHQAIQIEKLIESLNRSKQYKSRFITRVGDQIKFINTADIAYFFADDNIVFMLSPQGRYIVEHTLNELENFLDPKLFFRLNRSYIVHIQSIAKVHKFFNSRLKVELKPAVNDDILVSRIKVPDFLKWMES